MNIQNKYDKKGNFRKLFFISIISAFSFFACGQAAFNVEIPSEDAIQIPVTGSSGAGFSVIVQAEEGISIPSEATSIEIDKFLFDYTVKNNSSDIDDMKLTIKLSLCGEATVDGNLETRIISSTLGGAVSEPVYLDNTYKDVLKDYNGKTCGWTALALDLPVATQTSINKHIDSTGNVVWAQIFKQDALWIVGQNEANVDAGVVPTSSDYLELNKMLMTVEGYKETGSFPGVFGEL